MKTTLKILITLLTLCGALSARAQFYVTFDEPTNNAVVQYAHYDLWVQPINTTNPTSWLWLAQVPAGNTSINIPANIPNPAVFSMTASDTNGVMSAYSPTLFFDTNLWQLLPPGPLMIHRR